MNILLNRNIAYCWHSAFFKRLPAERTSKTINSNFDLFHAGATSQDSIAKCPRDIMDD